MPPKKRPDAFKATAHSIPGDLPPIKGEFLKWLGGFAKKHIAVVRLSIQGKDKAKAVQCFDVTLSSIPQSARRPRVTLHDEEEDGREGFTIGETVPPVWRTAALDLALQIVALQWSHEFDATPVDKRPRCPF